MYNIISFSAKLDFWIGPKKGLKQFLKQEKLEEVGVSRTIFIN